MGDERIDFEAIRRRSGLVNGDRMDQGNFGGVFRTIRDEVGAEEWQARVQLAACYRLIDLYGMSDLIYNHCTLRVPGTAHMLINLYGLTYKEITASSLARIDLDGNVLWTPDTDYGINTAGFVIHSAIHQARPDAHAVIHTHTRAGMAVAAMRCGLLPASQHAMRFQGHIGYHDYEGPATSTDERARLAVHLGPHNAMVLRNHGLVTCGASAAEAFNLLYQLEMACRAQVDMMAAGLDALQLPPAGVVETTASIFAPGGIRRYGLLEWPAMLRRLEAESRNSGFPHYAT